MNRREFIKASIPAAAIPAIAITCKYEDDEKGPEKESSWKRWDYVVYCYEREQGEWCFSQNIKGSFAYQREYMTFDEENDLSWNPHYAGGWMDGGKLHFTSVEDACGFVDMHVRTKEDINILDSIYDIYYLDLDDPRLIDNEDAQPTEIQVAHYWFNGDTGRQIHWVSERPYTNWNKVEAG